jgi:multidrug efflux pump
MNISNFAIQHKTSVIILTVIIIFSGTVAYITLPREAMPDITLPYILIFSNYEGTSPSDMESLVTRPLERKLKSLTDIKQMTSTSKEGFSQIVVEFNPDVKPDDALQKVRDKVSQAKGDLPSDMRDPTISEISSSDWPIMFVVISGEVGMVQLKKIAEDLKDQIETVKGVIEAEISGGREREIRVEFNQDRLASYGLTLSSIVQTVTNNNQNIPGGTLDIGEARYVLKSPAEFSSPAEIDNIVVSVRDGKPVYLTDVASIRDTFKDRDSFSRLDGVEAVSLRITKRPGEHILRVAGEIKKITEEMQRKLPAQVSLTITSDMSKMVNTLVKDLGNNILTAVILVLVVIFASLGFRNAMLVATAIPLSMLITFFTLQTFGITMNFVVLFSLVLASGMLVDNAIVIVENIYRHYASEGKPRDQAAMDATNEVLWPVVTSTLTTVVAFLPLVFWPGIMGEFLFYLPVTVITALMASLFVALIINPTLTAMFVKHSKRDQRILEEEQAHHYGPIIGVYRKLLSFTLHYRVLFLFCFFGLFVLVLYAYSKSGLGVEFFPNTQPSRLMVNLKTPEGTNVQQTNNFALLAEKIINKYGNIEHVTTTVGGDEPNTAEITIDMVDKEFRRDTGADGKIYFQNSNNSMEAMRNELLATIVGAEIRVDKEEMGPPVGKPINVEIHGEDYTVLANISKELQSKIKNLPGIVDLTDDYQAALPEIKVKIDKERAALLGLDAYLIGQIIKAAVNGTEVGKYREGEDEFDIVIRLPEDQRQDIRNILRLRIPGYTGEQVPLSSVATVNTTSGLAGIKHVDSKRVVTVSSNIAKGFNTPKVLSEVQKIATTLQLPEGYRFAYTGENQEMQESQTFMFKSFGIAVLLVALVIVAQFDSISMTFIIMTSVILSLIGVFLDLIITQKSFGVIMTGMGVISLAGVVVNNAIVLLDYINVLRRRSMPFFEAIVTAGATRFRPVMLTAVATILGLLPMAVAVDFDFYALKWNINSESSEMWGPMATCVIFGMILATVLTLFVVPCLYSLFYERGDKKKIAKLEQSLAGLSQSYEKDAEAV